ncbi:MAG: glycosyltransferase [Mucilaginibacter polytrichastri]|nr:glycosyltransferase [Mucilaginibacter polytrichastri]
MIFIGYIWLFIQIVIGFNLVWPLLLHLIYLLRKKERFDALNPYHNRENDYGVIVTAYEQVTSIPAVVNSLLKMDHEHFMIYVVADACDISTLHFSDPRVVILRPEERLASNTRSHFYAIEHFARKHNKLTIIDSDNLVEPDYLKQLDLAFSKGYRAVQGVRAAKNMNTLYASLDAARDIYYHYYDGKLLFQSGSSATLAGSGMAFDVELYEQCLGTSGVSGAGFDKVLQYRILSRNERIAFQEKAVVYDEKTTIPDQLVKQRSRWINTWFKYFSYGFSVVGKGLANFNANQFLFGLVLLRPPLFIFLLLSVLFGAVNLLINPVYTLVWAIGLLLFVLGFFIALWNSETDPRIYRSLTGIPKFVFLQVISLFKARGANKRSVATTHYYTEEEGK